MAEEEWIWGNHRGGGGAPLLSETGEQVYNLRDVARGNVQVDHTSPSGRRMKDQRGYDGDYSRDHSKGDRETGWSREISHNDYEDNRHRQVSPRHQPSGDLQSNFVSPSHRGARKNMFVSDSERVERLRKAREYQESLREQVEEKRRQKETEEREKIDRKKREYEEYMSQHYKGKAPHMINTHQGAQSPNGTGGKKNSPQDYDNYDSKTNNSHYGRRDEFSSPHYRQRDQEILPGGRRNEQATPPGNGRREQPTPPRVGRREQATPPRRRNREQMTPPRNGRRELASPPGLRDGSLDGRQRDDRGMKRPSERSVISPITNEYRAVPRQEIDVTRGVRRGGDTEEGWVSKVEYEELSSLCQGLMKQQKELEKQLEQQNHIIQGLQSGTDGGIKGPNTGARRGPRVRDGGNNVMNKKVNNKQEGSKVKQGSNIEKKISSRQAAALAAAEKRKKPKVSLGFGSRIETAKEKEKRERIAANAVRSQSHSGSRSVKASSIASSPNRETRPKSMRQRVEGGGFKQLQAQIDCAAKGPKVVTYDDEVGGNMKHVSPEKFRRSVGQGEELRGASDLMYFKGSDVDRISEDQLDKLLCRASEARY